MVEIMIKFLSYLSLFILLASCARDTTKYDVRSPCMTIEGKQCDLRYPSENYDLVQLTKENKREK